MIGTYTRTYSKQIIPYLPKVLDDLGYLVYHDFMINGMNEKQAREALKRLFNGVNGNQITRKQILDKISYKTLTNYSPALVGYGLWTPKRSGRKYTSWELTDKGKEVLVLGAPTIPEQQTLVPRVTSDSDIYAEAIRITNEFNDRYKAGKHEWRLVEKG